MHTLHIPPFRLPALLARVGAGLPQWPHALTLCAALNAAARTQMLPAESLRLLAGRRFLIQVLDCGARAGFTCRNGWFMPLRGVPQAPDLIFSANLSTFLQMLARQEDPDTLFFRRELGIEGDTELGLAVKNMLDAVEWPQLSFIRTRLTPCAD